MPSRTVHVRVPGSSANLGPGYDCFAAALALHLDLEVSEAEAFGLTSELDLPRDRTNLVVRAFERLHPADRLHFAISSEIPLSGGLGSSAAAIVAGLLAAVTITNPRGGPEPAETPGYCLHYALDAAPLTTGPGAAAGG